MNALCSLGHEAKEGSVMAGTELKYGRGYKIVQSVILVSFLFLYISSYFILFSLFFCFRDCVILVL